MEEVIEDIINMESSFNDEGIGCSETPLLMQRTVSILWNSILLFVTENFIEWFKHTSQRLKQYYQWIILLTLQLLIFLSRNVTGKGSNEVGRSWFKWSE